jgi:hypothetical protein
MHSTPDQFAELLTEREAAGLLALKNPRTLSVWRCTGRHNIPYLKIGRNVRYRKEDLLRFLASSVKTAPDSQKVAI